MLRILSIQEALRKSNARFVRRFSALFRGKVTFTRTGSDLFGRPDLGSRIYAYQD